MKKFALFLAPLLAISFLTNCGKKPDPTPPGPKLYIVTFDSNGGSAVPAQAVEENKCAVKPADPTHAEGDDVVYTFKEWQLNGTAFNFSEPITSDIILKAEWNVVNKFTVTFDSNGGSAVPIQKVAPGKCAVEPNKPSKTETAEYKYEFEYWALNGEKFKFNTPINSNIELKAVWKSIKQKYTITWKDGDDTEIGKQTYEYGDTPIYPSDWKVPSKAGDAQWGRYEFKNQWEPSIKPVTGDITYKPVFEGKDIKSYTVKWLNDDEQTILYSKDFEYGQTPEYKGATPKSTKTPTNPDHYYAFKGWDKIRMK